MTLIYFFLCSRPNTLRNIVLAPIQVRKEMVVCLFLLKNGMSRALFLDMFRQTTTHSKFIALGFRLHSLRQLIVQQYLTTALMQNCSVVHDYEL